MHGLWRSEVYLLSPHDTPSIPKTRLLRPVDWPAGTEVAFSVTERGAKLGNYKVVKRQYRCSLGQVPVHI